MAEGYFDPLPKGELDLDKIKQWVQNNVDTFRRSIAMQGTLFSADFVSGTSGWRLSPTGGAEFNEDVVIGGADTTTAQLKIHNVLEHIALFENDGANYPEDIFVFDLQAEIARFFWLDLNGVGATINYGGLRIHGPSHATQAHDIELQDSTQSAVLRWDESRAQFQLEDGSASAPILSFLASGQDDVGIYRAGTDEIGVAVGGAEVARFTADGLIREIVTARTATDTQTTITSATEAQIASVTLAIPSHWNTYDIECWNTVQLTDASGGNSAASVGIVLRNRLTNTSGTSFSGLAGHEITDSNNMDSVGISWQGFLEGQTATGSVVVIASIAGHSYNYQHRRETLIVHAYRTS